MSHKTAATVAHTIGIDTGKNTLHLIGLDEKGAIVLREKIARGRIAARFANVPRCLIGIEAGMATHYVARELIALGHDVRQVPPAYAKPFRQGHKNDFRDAYAVAEAGGLVLPPIRVCFEAYMPHPAHVTLHSPPYRASSSSIVGSRISFGCSIMPAVTPTIAASVATS